MKGMGRMRIVVAIGLTLGAVAPAAAQAPPPPVVVVAAEAAQPNPDAVITASIKARMLENVMLRNAQLIISSKNGFVTLSGMVTNDFAHEEALDIARHTVGVVKIDDQLRMEISSPSAPTRN